MSIFPCTTFFTQLHISGKDARRYLQGRLTQDLNRLNEKNVLETLLLTPAGLVCGKALLCQNDSEYELFVEALPTSKDEQIKCFTDELLRFKVADQVECHAITDSPFQLICYDNEDCAELSGLLLSGLLENTPCLQLPKGGIAVFKVKPQLGKLLTETTDSAENMFTNFRLRNRYPLFSVDITSKNSVAQVPMTSAVSFGKGCYAGQEVVERSSSRGKVSEMLLPFSCPASLAVAEIESALLDSGLTGIRITGCTTNLHDNCCYGFAWIKGLTEDSKLPDGFSLYSDKA